MAQEYPIEYILGRGLTPEEHRRIDNNGDMSICKNVRLSESGYYPIIIPTNSITNMPSYSWPYPQIFVGDDIVLVADATNIWRLNDARTIATAITLLDATSVGSSLAIQSGSTEPWHFATVENYWYMTNGQTQVFYFPGVFATSETTKALVANSDSSNNTAITIKVQSVVADRNRFVFGGITGVGADVPSWSTLFDTYRYNVAEELVTSDEQVLGDDWLLWGEVGGGDVDWPFTFIMQLLAYHTSTSVTRTREFMLAQLESGKIGMARMKASSSIQRLAHGSNGDVLVMSDNISSIAQRVGNGFTAGPSFPHGVASRGAYAAGLLIDQNGELIDANDNFSIIGYETELSALTAASIQMVHNNNERETYISDSSTGYVYNRFGLSESTTFVTSVMDGNVGTTNGAASPNNFSIQTLVENFRYNGIKTVSVMEVIAQGLASVTAYVSFWEPELAAYVELGPIYGSPDLTFDLQTSGSQFKFRLDGTLAAADKLERLLVRYSFAEGKSVRGPRGAGLGEFQGVEAEIGGD